MNNSALANVRKALTPKQGINRKAISNQFKLNKNKGKIKLVSKFQNSNSHLNELIEKMKYFKNLLIKTNDIKSLLILDAYGIKHSNELKKIVNNRVKTNNMFNNNPNLYNNSNKSKKRIQKNIQNEENKNSKLFLSFNNEKKISKKKEEPNKEDEFNLSNIIKTSKEKNLSKEYITKAKKNKKLFNLKAQIYYADKHKLIMNKKFKNLLFVRNVIKKDKYDGIKSKYKRPKTADIKYKIKNNISKINNSTNHQYNMITDELINGNDYKNELSENLSIKSPNITLYRESTNKSSNIPIKQKFKHIIFNNNFNDLKHQYEYWTKNENFVNYDKISENESQEVNNSITFNFKKKYFLDKLNKLENKSNLINHNFSSFTNKSQEISTKIFNRMAPKTEEKNNIYEKVNIKEINEHFNFSKGFESDLETLLKKNATKVKKIMDKNCGKIIDKVVKEICLEEKKLNKNYFLYLKDLKPKDKTKILRKYNDMFKGKKSDILDIFKDKEEDFINAIKSKKNYVSDIEQIYRKYKIINAFNK